MDIRAWLRELGLERYQQAFRANDIDANLLRGLTSDDLKELGVASLGHRKLMLEAIAALDISADDDPDPTATPGSDTATPATVASRQAPRPEAERRQLTVMFVDLVGSTELAGRLDPEDLGEVMRTYQKCCADVVKRWGGHVAKYMGDGILAYFGWPQAHEDDAERAVRTGLDLAAAVATLTTPAGDPLAARVGIATGLVMVGERVGEGAAQEEAVVGETPNLAARLQTMAEPGQVMIAESTRRLLGRVFELSDLGTRRLKGIAEPVQVCAVIGEQATASRFEARSGPSVLPMVGRDQELALLLERWARAKAGEGQGILLVGEAGIGKSRIARALLDAVATEPHTLIRYQCSPFHTDSALWPVIQQLGRAAGFTHEDRAETRLDKLEAVLGRSGVPGRVAPLVADLLGIDGRARYGLLDLTAQAQRARTLEALVERLIAFAGRHPVLLVLEDAHWIDPTTLEMIEQSLDRIAATPVLMLLTSRPDDQPELAAHPHVTRLTFNRLGRAGVEAIVARLGGGRLPTRTLDTIIARTDGVPLFVEELTKAVLETGETTIPTSLHDSLMARLDRLPEAKEIAQIAACIGRDFSHVLLAAIADRNEPDLMAAIDQLLGGEIVFRRGSPPDATYSFKHALLQDAAYQSLLRSRRRDVHARVVEALEALSGNLEAADLGVLAHHCARAGLAEKAADNWYRASQQAIARSAMAEAVEQLGRGLEALVGLRDGLERRRKELDLQIALGGALIGLKGHAAEETGHAFARARALCHEVGDAHRLMPVLGGQLGIDVGRGAPRAAHEIAIAMLGLAEQHADSSLLIQAHRGMSSAALELGRFAVAREHAERLLAIYDPARHSAATTRGFADMRTVALGYLAQALFALGYPDQARRASNDQISLARGQAHSSTLPHALFFGCIFRRHAGDVEGLSEVVNGLHAVADEQDLAFFSRCAQLFRGWLFVELGRTDEGLVEAERAATAFADAQEQIMRAHASGLLAEAFMTAGRPSEALRWSNEAITWTDNGIGLVYEGEQHRCHGHVLLALSERDEVGAESSFCRSIDLARAQDAKMRELRAATSLAGLWAGQGEGPKALDMLAPVYDWFTEGFDTPDLIAAKALLDELG